MKILFISLAFFAVFALSSTSLKAQTIQQDTAGAYNQGVSEESSSISDFASKLVDWITSTVWDALKDLVTGSITDGFTSLGGDIESGWDTFTSWFGTKEAGGGGKNTILSATSDSTIVVKNGVFSTGFLIGTSVGLWNNTGGQYGATLVCSPTLGQKTVYTIPDPGTTTANFMVDAGNSTIGGNRTFSGHILSSSTVGSASFDGTVVSAGTVTGSDLAGVVTLSTTTTAGEGTVTVPFASAYSSAPTVIVTPANLNAQAGGDIAGFFVSATATHFTLNVKGDGTAVTGAQFNYIVLH